MDNQRMTDPDLHHHYLSSGGHTLTHSHPGGRRNHEGRGSPYHKGHDRGAYYSHPGPAPDTAEVRRRCGWREVRATLDAPSAQTSAQSPPPPPGAA